MTELGRSLERQCVDRSLAEQRRDLQIQVKSHIIAINLKNQKEKEEVDGDF